LLVLPTGTLLKLTAAGLVLSAADCKELAVAEVEVVAAEVGVPLALVTPVQPERSTANAKTVELRKRVRPRRLRCALGLIERNRRCEFLENADTTRPV
jgi:hypothetical protein